MLKKEIVLSEVKEMVAKVNDLLETINEETIDLKQSREKLGRAFGEGVDILVANGVMPEPEIVNYYNRIFADDAEPEPAEEEEVEEEVADEEPAEEEEVEDDEDEEPLEELDEEEEPLEELDDEDDEDEEEPDELTDDDLAELDDEIEEIEEIEEEEEPEPEPPPKKTKPKKTKGKKNKPKPKTKQPEKEASMEASVEVLKGLTTKKAIKEYCKKHLPDVEIKFLTKDTVAQMKAKVIKAMKKPSGTEKPDDKPKTKAKSGKKPAKKAKKAASGGAKKGKKAKGKGKGAPKSKSTGKTALSGTDCFGFKIGGKTHQFAMLIGEGPRTMAAVAKEGLGSHPKALKKMIEAGMMKRDKSGVISLTAPGKKKYTAFKKTLK